MVSVDVSNQSKPSVGFDGAFALTSYLSAKFATELMFPATTLTLDMFVPTVLIFVKAPATVPMLLAPFKSAATVLIFVVAAELAIV